MDKPVQYVVCCIIEALVVSWGLKVTRDQSFVLEQLVSLVHCIFWMRSYSLGG